MYGNMPYPPFIFPILKHFLDVNNCKIVLNLVFFFNMIITYRESVSFFTISIAVSISSWVLKYEKLNLIAPCLVVPNI